MSSSSVSQWLNVIVFTITSFGDVSQLFFADVIQVFFHVRDGLGDFTKGKLWVYQHFGHHGLRCNR